MEQWSNRAMNFMSWKEKLKQYSQKGELWITIFFVIAILAVVNFLSYQIFARWDLTQNNRHSISSASIETVENLEDVVNIKVYLSENLPNRYIKLRRDIRDTLNEYQAYSDGKMKVEFINPEKELDNPRRKLRMLGIPQIQFNVMKKGSYKVARGYMGMAVQYKDNNEPIPVVKEADDLEYKITMAIKKATQEQLTKVGVLTGHGTLSLREEMKTAYEKLKELYRVERVDLEQNDSIPAGLSTLIIPGPTQEFSEKQLKALDGYLMGGGNIFLLQDGVSLQAEQRLSTKKNNTGLNDLLTKYGVKINKDLVVDKNCGQVSFSSGFMAFRTDYPLWPKIQQENFNSSVAAVSDLESMVLPWASSIERLEESKATSTTITTLARSGENSWTQDSSFRVNPEQDFRPSGNTSPSIMAAQVSGTIPSAYSDKRTNEGKIVLVGDSDLIKERFLGQTENSAGNLIFFQNVVGSLSLEDDLISIRSQEVTDRPIISLTGEQKKMIKYFNIFSVPVVVLIIGMIRYYLRKRSLTLSQLMKESK